MIYNFNNKKIDNKIDLTRIESEIFEELIKLNGQPVKTKELTNIIYEKYCLTKINPQDPSDESIRTWICKINKKANKIIKNRPYFGYYIDEEIKMM